MGVIENLESPNFKVTKSDKILIEYIKNNIKDVFTSQYLKLLKKVI